MHVTDHRSPFSVLICFGVALGAHAQDVQRNIQYGTDGFVDQGGSVPSLFVDEGVDLTGISGQFSLNALYNSNVNNGNARGADRPEQSSVVITPNLSLNYTRQNEDWTLGGGVTISRRQILDQSDLNATNYSLQGSATYSGAALSVGGNVRFASSEGVNRLNADFVQQETIATGLTADYRISPLTSVSVGWNYSRGTGAQLVDVESYNTNASVLWQATPLLSIGPGLRYAVRTGGQALGDLTQIGPTISVNYQLGTVLSISSTFGYNRTETPARDEDVNRTNWSVALNYQRERWAVNLGMNRDIQPVFIAGGGFDLTTSYTLGYTRRLGFGQLGVNLSYNHRDPEDSGVVVGNARDSEFLNLRASLSFPVFAERANFNIFAGWNEQTANDGDFSWDGYQIGSGLSYSF